MKLIKSIIKKNLKAYKQYTNQTKRYLHYKYQFIRKLWTTFGIRSELGKITNKSLYIIAIPGCVHILHICLYYIPEHTRVIVIANGLLDEEISWISEEPKVNRLIKLPHKMVHSDVLDILFLSVRETFAIIDYDCFVLNQKIWDELFVFDPLCQGNAYFYIYNESLNLKIPFTFFLSFNAPIFRSLMQKYNIDSSQIVYKNLHFKVRKKLMDIKIDQDNMPETKKQYFDTIKVLQMLGIADGYPIRFQEYTKNEIIHVGGVSYWNGNINQWTARGAYFWHRALEIQPNVNLQVFYTNLFGSKTSQEILDTNPLLMTILGSDALHQYDEIIKKTYLA